MVGSARRSAGQLELPIEVGQLAGVLPRRFAPMLAGRGEAPFDDPGWFFEPWWPGARCFASIESGRLRLQVDHLADALATFPELRVICDQVRSDGVVLDGTLMVLDDQGRPDTDLLRRRLADPDERRGEGAFVASDLLWAGGDDLRSLAFGTRRARLLAVLRDGDRCVVGRGLHVEGLTLADAAASMGLEAVSARRLDGRWRAGIAADDWLRLPVVRAQVTDGRPILVLLQRLPLDS